MSIEIMTDEPTDSFDEFMSRCWKAHTKNPADIRVRLEQYLERQAVESQLVELSALACHIDGEHLGDWAAGAAYYNRLFGRFPTLPSATRHRLQRQAAILLKANDPTRTLEAFSDEDRLYITALAVPAAALRLNAAKGQKLLAQAMVLFDSLGRTPRHSRLLGVVTANLTSDLLEVHPPMPMDISSFMMTVAETSVSLWCAVGTEKKHKKAAYRLTLCHLRKQAPPDYGSGRYPRSYSIEP